MRVRVCVSECLYVCVCACVFVCVCVSVCFYACVSVCKFVFAWGDVCECGYAWLSA